MAMPRQRYDHLGRARPCEVRLPAKLAEFLYRERLLRHFRDETELLASIVRAWAETLDPMDWSAVLAMLKAEEATASEESQAA